MYRWIKLKFNCPFDIGDLIKNCKKLKFNLYSIDEGWEEDYNVLAYAPDLNTILSLVFALLIESDGNGIKNEFFTNEFKNNFALMLRSLEEDEESCKTEYKKQKILAFKSKIESILDNIVYYPLKRTGEMYSKDKQKYINKVTQLIGTNISVFGNEYLFRQMRKGIQVPIPQSPTPKLEIKEEGEKISEEKNEFPEFNELIEADKMLKKSQ